MDIMHDFLEGILQYEVKELLKHLMFAKMITLIEVNDAIVSFPYGSTDVTDKPAQILLTTLRSSDHSIKQSGMALIYEGCIMLTCNFFLHAFVAAQMWCLGRNLPLMIGGKIRENQPHWDNFLLLLTIIDYVFAPVTSIDIVDYLRQLIHDHHSAFKELYPDSPFIPKLHYIIHIPEWINRYVYKCVIICIPLISKHT